MKSEIKSRLNNDSEWWRGAVIYQIYPRSFMDSNDDGIGDLKGITSKLDYIAELNVDAIWISPFFTSPMADFGYDVSNYCDVDPIFGSLEDFKALVAKAHSFDLKVIIDQVYSHSSDQHEWFKESRTDKENSKADWYVWADAKPDGTAPNNWLSLFGGPAWQWDTKRKQYFQHNFLSSQPDLNFHNLEVQNAILNTAKFWLDIGVDGFRLDVVNMFFHDKDLKDNPIVSRPEELFVGIDETNPFCRQYHINQMCRDENLDFLSKFRTLMNGYPNTTTVGEIGAPDGMSFMAQYTSGGDKLHMAYTFELLGDDCSPNYLRKTLSRVEDKLHDGWPCFALSNHDVTRSATRWAKNSSDPEKKIKTILAFLMTIRGSVCLYQGEELGLTESPISFVDLQDPFGIEFWPDYKGRDGCRTPMPWNTENGFGFSEGVPWLPMDKNFQMLSVETQINKLDSTLNFNRKLLAWRRKQSALRDGQFKLLNSNEDLLAFSRFNDQQTLFIYLNLTESSVNMSIPEDIQLVYGDLPVNNQQSELSFSIWEQSK